MSAFTETVSKIHRSVVAIGFHPNPREISITGSGFFIDKSGLVVTCAHVYNQTPKEVINNLKVLVLSEEKGELLNYKWVNVKLVSKNDDNDVAILKLEDTNGLIIENLELGDSDSVKIGQEVFFAGYPYAAQLLRDNFGITSHISKTIISNIKIDGHKFFRNWIFVDTISNPGCSGSPLIDTESRRVVGIMSISFRNQSQVVKDLDVREPMHIAGAKPINFVKQIIKSA